MKLEWQVTFVKKRAFRTSSSETNGKHSLLAATTLKLSHEIFDNKQQIPISQTVRPNVIIKLGVKKCFWEDVDNNNNNNNNNNSPETRKYWVDVQRGIVSSHGERDPL